ncbi:hypothetical protein BMS3Bbin02_00021 [bacterium BMS3Bbin02]|nr:hypothetical protein BMS3Bbin02_00021 [bacterium BMS3Bbin02]
MDDQERARLERMNAIDRLGAPARPEIPRGRGGLDFTFSATAATVFRELAATLRGAAHPTLSHSQLVELLVAHWGESPPDSRWVLDFNFVTKRGRPRTPS